MAGPGYMSGFYGRVSLRMRPKRDIGFPRPFGFLRIGFGNREISGSRTLRTGTCTDLRFSSCLIRASSFIIVFRCSVTVFCCSIIVFR